MDIDGSSQVSDIGTEFSTMSIPDAWKETFERLGVKTPMDLMGWVALKDEPIEALDLSVRAFNCFKREGLHTVFQLVSAHPLDILGIRGLGEQTYENVNDRLRSRGLWFGMEPLQILRNYVIPATCHKPDNRRRPQRFNIELLIDGDEAIATVSDEAAE